MGSCLRYGVLKSERSEKFKIIIEFQIADECDSISLQELCDIRSCFDKINIDLVRYCFNNPIPFPELDQTNGLTYDYIEVYEKLVYNAKRIANQILKTVETQLRAKKFYYRMDLVGVNASLSNRYVTNAIVREWLTDAENVQQFDETLRSEKGGSVGRRFHDICNAFGILSQAIWMIDACILLQEKCEICGKSEEYIYMCKGCERAWYCGEKCQKVGWKTHKEYCGRIDKVYH